MLCWMSEFSWAPAMDEIQLEAAESDWTWRLRIPGLGLDVHTWGMDAAVFD